MYCRWGGEGASDRACTEIYMGSKPFSESETQAVANFVMKHRNNIKVGSKVFLAVVITLVVDDNEDATAAATVVGDDAIFVVVVVVVDVVVDVVVVVDDVVVGVVDDDDDVVVVVVVVNINVVPVLFVPLVVPDVSQLRPIHPVPVGLHRPRRASQLPRPGLPRQGHGRQHEGQVHHRISRQGPLPRCR